MSWQAEMLGIDLAKLYRERYTCKTSVHTWVSLATGARLTGYSHDTVRRYAKRGELASMKLSGRLMVSQEDCLTLEERRGRLSA